MVSFYRVLFMMVLLLVAASPASAQNGQPGPTSVIDIILIGVLIYFVFRMFSRGRNNYGDKNQGGPGGRTRTRPEDLKPQNRHQQAENLWDLLSSDQEPSTPTGETPGNGMVNTFDGEEFLEGARVFFSRVMEAKGSNDFSGLKEFMSLGMYEELTRDARETPAVHVDVLMVEARLMEVAEENGVTRATVFFDATIRLGDSIGEAQQLRQAWEFSRQEEVPGAFWALDKISPVDH